MCTAPMSLWVKSRHLNCKSHFRWRRKQILATTIRSDHSTAAAGALALLFWQLVIRNFRELPHTRIPRTGILPRIAMPVDLIEHEQTYR